MEKISSTKPRYRFRYFRHAVIFAYSQYSKQSACLFYKYRQKKGLLKAILQQSLFSPPAWVPLFHQQQFARLGEISRLERV